MELSALRVDPAHHGDEVGHEAGDAALHHGVVPENDVLVNGPRLVGLGHRWCEQVKEQGDMSDTRVTCAKLIGFNYDLKKCIVVFPVP